MYAPDINTLHVEITDGAISGEGDNIQYSKNAVYPGAAVSNPILTTTFNYGEAFNSQVSHTEVKNGGKLYTYGNFADTKSNNTPPTGQSQTYYLGSGCSAEVLEVDNNGELIIGDQAAGNYATLHVRETTTVRIKAGGKLTVEYGALEIADGGTFIFEDGAQIHLPGYASVLKIKGKLSVGDNANFTFTGNGRLVFDQNIPWAQNAGTGTWHQELDDYWDIGQNASFTVEGSATNPDYNHVLIEAMQPVSMKMEDGTTFGQVNIKYGRVALHDDALFFVFSPVNLQFVKFNTAYSWQRHGGFRIFNNPGPNAINRCKFENGEVGALAQWSGGGPAVHFDQCEFTNNGTGLEVQGGNFSVSLGTFTNNGQGIKAEFLTGNSIITGTNVTRQNVNSRAGIGASSQTGAYVSVRNCDISNYKAALSFEYMNSRVECSQLKWNDIGISQINGFLDIGEEAGNIFLGSISADVSFGEDNGLGIGISLEDGYNDFAASGAMGPWYVNGFFENNVPSSVVGDNNKMPVYIDNGTTKLRVLIEDWSISPPVTVPFVIDPNKNLTSIPSFVCDGATHNPGLESAYVRYVGSLQSAGKVAGGGYNGEPVLDAALDALSGVSFGENIRQDDSALVKITDLLNAPIEEGNSNTALVKKALYNQMHQALGNAYQYGYLTNVQNEAGQVNDTVMDVVNVIQSALAAVDLTDTNSY